MTRSTSARKLKTVKHTVKFLSHAHEPALTRSIIHHAPPEVVKAISNAALNALKGDISLHPANRKIFSQHRKSFEVLTNRQIPLAQKKNYLVRQKGGFSFLPILAPLLGTVLGSIGSAFISRSSG
jgi:hypothetical protein